MMGFCQLNTAAKALKDNLLMKCHKECETVSRSAHAAARNQILCTRELGYRSNQDLLEQQLFALE